MLKNGIDPRIVYVFGVWTSVLLMIAGFGPSFFDGALPPAIGVMVVAWCSKLGAINSCILTGGAYYSGAKPGPGVTTPPSATMTVVKILIAAFALSIFLPISPAHAQNKPLKLKTPQQVFDDIKGAGDQAKAAVTGRPVSDPSAAVPCDYKMLTKLTPENLIPTMKGCGAKQDAELVTDVTNALASAKAFSGSGDADGINCLTPGLAIVQAAQHKPAVPAVLNADGTVQTPAIPEQEPGVVTLFQKYREFTLAGGLTSCQTWLNGPVQATIAAGANAVAGVGTAAVAAVAVAPKLPIPIP